MVWVWIEWFESDKWWKSSIGIFRSIMMNFVFLNTNYIINFSNEAPNIVWIRRDQTIPQNSFMQVVGRSIHWREFKRIVLIINGESNLLIITIEHFGFKMRTSQASKVGKETKPIIHSKKSLKSSCLSQLLGKFLKFIQGSVIRIKFS